MRRARHIGRRNRARRAFSLIELLLALGILAIGLSMAAALFPAAIRLNEQSGQDSIGTIVAENGLAVAQTMLHNSAINQTAGSLVCVVDESMASPPIDRELQHYLYDPSAPGAATRGFVVLGRRLDTADPSGPVQLVIVSYNKQSSANIVNALSTTFSTTTSNGVTVAALGTIAPIGSPLIVAADGSWAKIIDRDSSDPSNPNKGTLDRALSATGGGAFVIVDPNATAKSPATAVVVADVLLNP